jgi:DNA invertase Pin-like site-specific DNA recombinase
MPIIWGYCRVSTGDQGAGLAAQRQAIIQAGVDARFLRVDEGVSGTLFGEDRPALEALLKEVRAEDVIIVHKLDRLGRSVRGVLNLIASLTQQKIVLKVLVENIDTTTPHGKFMLHVLLALAEMERNMISSRTKTALAEIKRTGIGKSGKPVRVGGQEKVTATDVEEMRRLLDAGAKVSNVAPRYGISRETVYARVGAEARAKARAMKQQLEKAAEEEERAAKYKVDAPAI